MMLAVMLLVGTLLEAAVASAAEIEAGAEAWVIATDISPFSLVHATLRPGGGGVDGTVFGDHPDNFYAGAKYTDEARLISVGVGVTRDVRTAYIDHLIEDEFRDNARGRFHHSTSLISLFGSPVFLYCNQPPDCRRRLYEWRSGSDLVISVSAGTVRRDITPGADPPLTPRRSSDLPPCAEPTEVLQAYLERYPSALTLYSDSDERAAQWQRDMLELELAAAQYKLTQQATVPGDQLAPGKVARIADHLLDFAKGREAVLSGPKFQREEDRIEKLRELALPKRLQELQRIADEYRNWWRAQGHGEIEVPPLPPPTPTAAPTPVNTPTP
jgi:hypothetical protein